MSLNRKSTYTYAPKIVTDDTHAESVKKLEELLKSKAPIASDHPDVHTVIDTAFVTQSPTVKVEYHAAPQSSTANINEILNRKQYQQYHEKQHNNSPDTVVYSPTVVCTPDNSEAAMKQFDEIHRNRPQPGSAKNVVVSHSFTQTGKTMTLAELMQQFNSNKQNSATKNEFKDSTEDSAAKDTISFSMTK